MGKGRPALSYYTMNTIKCNTATCVEENFMCCKEKDCIKSIVARGWCRKHYHEWYTYGEVRKAKELGFTRKPNKILEKESYAILILTNKNNEKVARVKIDKQDIEKVARYRWSYLEGYARNTTVGALHNFIMKKKDNELYDHINTNRLDCRRKNLRKCSKQRNNWNKSMQKNNTTGAKGVVLTSSGTYLVQIYLNNKNLYLGKYKDLLTAAKVYNRKAKELFGEFARPNNIKRLKNLLN